MKQLQFIFCFSIFILFFVSFVNANIKTTVNLIDSENGNFEKIRDGEELILSYDLTTGEKIKRPILVSREDSVDLSDELFCYLGCNIVPKRVIYKTWVKDGDEILSIVDAIVEGNEHNEIFNIYIGDKLNLEETASQIDQNNFYDDQEAIIEWSGNISVEDEGLFDLYINISGKILSLEVNEEKIEPINDTNFKLNFNKGDNRFKIIYSTNKVNNINLFWRTINETFSVIPENNLKFEKGSINEVSIEPQLETFSVSQFPSSYQIDYSVYPTAVKGYYSLTSGRTPILLIHGLHGSDNIDRSDTSTWTYWHSVPTKLKDKNNDVWILFYTPANVSNFLTSGMLKNEINDVLSYYSVSKLDVVSHSMGGLVTMGYLLNLGKDQFGNSVTYANNIRNFVSIDTPVHGSFSANRVITNQNLGSNLICNFLAWATGKGYDKDAQAYLDMAVGGEFTWLLHQSSLPTSISYLAIAGNEGMLCIPDETKEENSGDPGSGNDGLVAVSSASLLDKNIPLIILGNYNHANEVGTDPTGLFSVDTTKEVNIIDSFIKGQSVNTIKSYLGSGDYYIDPNNPSSNIFTRGSIVLKLTSNNPISSVKIKNPSNNQEYILTKFLDLRHNTQTNNWFYFSDNDLSMSYLNQRYGLTLPKGNYDIYINGADTSKDVEIKGAQTTMKEINLNNCVDNDEDGYGQNCALGNDCNDNNADVYPGRSERCDNIDNDCNGQTDEGYNVGTICYNGIGECQSQGVLVCTFDGFGQCNAIPKNPQPEICDGKDNNCNNVIDDYPICVQPKLTINSPKNNSFFNNRRVQVNLTVDKIVDEITYIDLLDSRGRERILCRNCFQYGNDRDRFITLNDGRHILKFRAGNSTLSDEEIIEIFIDSQKPKITKNEPKRGFTNGSFKVEFDEKYPISLKLRYGNLVQREVNLSIQNDCFLDRNKYNCDKVVMLNEFSGQPPIWYTFVLTDKGGSITTSRPAELRVDTTPPIINSITHNRFGGSVELIIDITEQNFDEVSYKDYSNPLSRERVLCTSLRNNQCVRRISLSTGQHNLIITAIDEAGNSVSQSVLV